MFELRELTLLSVFCGFLPQLFSAVQSEWKGE